MHVSGEQLDQYTGVAATLRYPLIHPDPEEAGRKDDSSDDDSSSDDDLVLEEEDYQPNEAMQQYPVNDFRRRLSSADETEFAGFELALGGFISNTRYKLFVMWCTAHRKSLSMHVRPYDLPQLYDHTATLKGMCVMYYMMSLCDEQ